MIRPPYKNLRMWPWHCMTWLAVGIITKTTRPLRVSSGHIDGWHVVLTIERRFTLHVLSDDISQEKVKGEHGYKGQMLE